VRKECGGRRKGVSDKKRGEVPGATGKIRQKAKKTQRKQNGKTGGANPPGASAPDRGGAKKKKTDNKARHKNSKGKSKKKRIVKKNEWEAINNQHLWGIKREGNGRKSWGKDRANKKKRGGCARPLVRQEITAPCCV